MSLMKKIYDTGWIMIKPGCELPKAQERVEVMLISTDMHLCQRLWPNKEISITFTPYPMHEGNDIFIAQFRSCMDKNGNWEFGILPTSWIKNTDNTFYEVTEADFLTSESDMYKEAAEGMHEWKREKELDAIDQLFKRSTFDYEFKELRLYQRFFYWLKTFLCLGFGLTNGSYINSIAIISWNETSNGECGGASWDCCWIGIGFLKNWRVCVGSDGT